MGECSHREGSEGTRHIHPDAWAPRQREPIGEGRASRKEFRRGSENLDGLCVMRGCRSFMLLLGSLSPAGNLTRFRDDFFWKVVTANACSTLKFFRSKTNSHEAPEHEHLLRFRAEVHGNFYKRIFTKASSGNDKLECAMYCYNARSCIMHFLHTTLILCYTSSFYVHCVQQFIALKIDKNMVQCKFVNK